MATSSKPPLNEELSRGGKVYFIHNRVDSIYMRASWIKELVPTARIGVGHGQMDEKEFGSGSC